MNKDYFNGILFATGNRAAFLAAFARTKITVYNSPYTSRPPFPVQDLVEDMKGDLSGHFLSTVKALLLPPAEYDASQLRKAMKGLGTDEDVLIEILCTRSNAQLKEIIRVYKESRW